MMPTLLNVTNNFAKADQPLVFELLFLALGIALAGYEVEFKVGRGGGQFVFLLHLFLLGRWW